MDLLLNSKSKDLKGRLLTGISKSIKILRNQKESLPVLRVQIPIEHWNILNWLSRQSAAPKIYWSARDGTFETGGAGAADMIQGTRSVDYKAVLGAMKKNLSAEFPHLRYYGGFCFDENNMDKEWEAFGAYRYWLPRFEMVHSNGETYFACNLTAKDLNNIPSIENEFDGLDFLKGNDSELHLLPKSRQDFPAYPLWAQVADHVIRSFESGLLEKVVLARKTLFHFARPLSAVDVMARVKVMSPDCFHFCFQTESGAAFLGASPERLYRRQGEALSTEAIAGTRPRGKTAADDENYRQELLNSAKDKSEHRFVVDTLRDNLLCLCREFETDPSAAILKLKDGQHLISRFEGTLKSEISDDEILATLHPTPAVAGCPTEEALKTIRQLEPFKRGWYAAPVGWVGAVDSEFAVAIRSGLIQNDQLALYSGAGLVKGSVPEAEWDEIENKMSGFMKVFR